MENIHAPLYSGLTPGPTTPIFQSSSELCPRTMAHDVVSKNIRDYLRKLLKSSSFPQLRVDINSDSFPILTKTLRLNTETDMRI